MRKKSKSNRSSGTYPIRCGLKRPLMKGGRGTEMEKRMENLIEESKRIVELLQQNFHPHTTVIIEADSIRVEETIAAELIQYDVD